MKKIFLFKSIISILLTLITSIIVSGQNENNNWIFGNRAGISFNTTPPSILNGSQLVTDEGVATASDPTGNLLFYTDGRTVWNRAHQIMANGDGLGGHISSSQSALITSDPGNCDKYYVFTTDGIENNLAKGLQYSIVNMGLNNGLGAIESKNIQLFSPVVEKMVAIPNDGDNSIWLISHQWSSSNFLIFKITNQGVELTRTQSIGEIHNGDLINAVGYMKASPDGRKIALINRTVSSAEIFKFDITNGLLSDNLTLGNQFNLLYGLEFSPNGENLFVGTSNQIFQFKIEPYNQTSVTSSKLLITTSSNLIRALQLAPDTKIYVALNNQSFIGAINSPNLIGDDTNFSENGINLGGMCKFGLPTKTVIGSAAGEPPFFDLGKDTTLCLGQILIKDISNAKGSYLWQDGSNSPKHSISNPGVYIASVTNSCGVHSDTLTVTYVEPISISLGKDKIICEGESIIFDVSIANGNYVWQDGSTNSSVSISKPGTYFVSVSNNCQTLKDTINIFSNNKSKFLPPDTILCVGNNLTLDVSEIFGEYQWQDGSNSPIYTINSPGEYSVNIEDRCGVVSDTILVQYRQLDLIVIPNVFTPNMDGYNDFFTIDSRLLGSTIKIINRWGKSIFTSSNYRNDWDAEGIPTGNYYYYITDICGTHYKGWLHVFK